jgi:hypothetical protein
VDWKAVNAFLKSDERLARAARSAFSSYAYALWSKRGPPVAITPESTDVAIRVRKLDFVLFYESSFVVVVVVIFLLLTCGFLAGLANDHEYRSAARVLRRLRAEPGQARVQEHARQRVRASPKKKKLLSYF